MANCFDYENCKGLVTIGYMKNMVKATPVSGCVTVNDGTTADTCCDETANGDNYVPTYGELSANTFTTARYIHPSDPSRDKNGFEYEIPSSANSICCEISTDKEALMTSGATFGYTWAESNELVITKQPDFCSPTCRWQERKGYSRHTFGCGTNGEIEEISSAMTSTTSSQHSVTLTKHVLGLDNYRWEVSFDPEEINGVTSTDCNRVSSSTWVNISGSYYIAYSLASLSSVPCDGGVYTIITITSTECADDLSFNVTTNNSDVSVNYYDTTVDISVPRNPYGSVTSCTVTIIPIVCGNSRTSDKVEFTFTREECYEGQWSPSVQVNNCSVFDTIIDWESDDPPIIVHDFD